MRFSTATCAVVVVLIAVSAVRAQDCTWNAPNGKTYDLTPLKKVGGSYNGYESATFSYAVNFCSAAINSKCPTTTSFQSIEISSSGACTGIAQSTVSPTFVFKNGADDADGIVARFTSTTTPTKTFTFELKCGTQEYPTEPLTVVYQSTGYVASNVLTKYACAKTGGGGGGGGGGGSGGDDDSEDGGLGGGAVFLIIFFVGGAVYLGGGVAYNMHQKQLRGLDAIPNRDFWTQVPTYVKDGCSWTWNKTKELFDRMRGGGGNYQATI
eukprot:TRINITY_DN1070_c0_g1_i1.p1 TRINITY_DN1070_c0_g1~~TRINITY_DN1070_c0_g1_i1.p1  ORF type:complete len:267 (-),score=45.11 TRINITY_DN1070_c0_g1_i1:227-1027(-)